MRKENTELKNNIYNYIKNHIEEYGFSPSYEDIADIFNTTKSNVFRYIKKLENEGEITQIGNHIEIKENYDKSVRIPVIGTIACGDPILAFEDVLGYIPVNIDWLGGGEYFGLQAKGDSMINIFINDGDIVIIRKQNTAENGEVVVAMISDGFGEHSATLKRFYKEKDYIRLHPENKYMDDIIVDDVIILGKAVKVIKDVI